MSEKFNFLKNKEKNQSSNIVNEQKNNDFETLRKENEILKIELEKQNDTLENLIGIFSIAAHDIRSSLSSVVGFSDILCTAVKNGEYSEDIVNYAEIIDKSGHNSLHLLEEMTNWIKLNIDNKNIEFTNLNLRGEFVKSIDSLYERTEKKNINLINNIKDNVDVSFDENILKTVIRNLLSNAIKFTNEGGEVSATSEEFDNSVKIYIKDNGVGLSKEKIENLFNKTMKGSIGTDNERGLGIGLYMCKRLMVKNNGDIEVESDGEGKGSTFIVTIPKGIKKE